MIMGNVKLFIVPLLFVFGLFSCNKFQGESEQMTLINEAKALLFLNKADEAEHLLNKMDTTQFNKKEMASFLLSKGFWLHLTGNNEFASDCIHEASLFFLKYGDDDEKAELFLINGLLLEAALLNEEASDNYLKAMDLFIDEGANDLYYYALLGVLRTDYDGDKFLQESKAYLDRNWESRKQVGLLTARAKTAKAPKEKLAFQLSAYQYIDDRFSGKEHIELLTNIAADYKALGVLDSAFHYLAKTKNLIKESKPDEKHILGYYLIKAEIEMGCKNHKGALASIDFVLRHGPEVPAMLSKAYRQRAGIYHEMGDYVAANNDLNKHIAYLKKADGEHQKYRSGQLRNQTARARLEGEMNEVKTFWLVASFFFLLMGMLAWVAFFYHKKRWANYKRELNDKYKLANQRLNEQVEQKLSVVAQQPAINSEKKSQDTAQNSAGFQEQTFYIFFNIEHPFFREKMLKAHPELSASNLKYCEGVLANQTVYETSATLGVTANAVKKARQKLRILLKCETTMLLAAYLNKVDKTPLEEIQRN